MTTAVTVPVTHPAKDWESQEPFYHGQLARKQIVNTHVFVVGLDLTTLYRYIRFFQYADNPYTILVDTDESLVSFGDEAIEPGYQSTIRFGDEAAIDPEYQRVIDSLKDGGRELMASEVYEMLLANKEPDGDPIQLFSLRAMADFLVRHRNIADPVAGPSPIGIMQLEWHILDDGLLVIAFVEDERVHCVVQADAMKISERMSTDALMNRHGHLIPPRYDEPG